MRTIYYSASFNSFFDSEVHASIPDDAKEVTEQYRQSVLQAAMQPGKQMKANNKSLPSVVDSPPPSLAEAKQRRLQDIKDAFVQAIEKPVTIDINGKTYQMDGKEGASNKLLAGIATAQLLEKESIDIVDFNNKKIRGVPLADAMKIAKGQAVFYQTFFDRQSDLKEKVIQARTLEDVASVSF